MPFVTRLLTAFVILALLLCTSRADAQVVDAPRAQAQLDAARSLIRTKSSSAATSFYAEMAGLEVKAGRPQKAREMSHFILGVMQQVGKDDTDRYLIHLAETYLAQDKTEDAVRALGKLSKSVFSADRLYLQAVHQTVRRFGLQRGIDLAREAFPRIMDRRNVYCKLCYTLAVKGEAKLAKEFIEVTMDLTEIFSKLDAYRYTAVGMYEAGDKKGAVELLEGVLPQVKGYAVASTRVIMFVDMASVFSEIGRNDRAVAMVRLAEGALQGIKKDDYQREGSVKKIALACAQRGEYDRALQWTATLKSKLGLSDVYKTLIKHDLKAGNVARARALDKQHRVYIGNDFEEQVALAAVNRGDINAGLAGYQKLAGGLISGDWHREAGQALARRGAHTALLSLATTIKKTDDRIQFHLGAAEGYLGE